MKNSALAFLLLLFMNGASFSGETVKITDRRINRIHRKILTVDSHTDTPLRMLQKDFDISARHDAHTDRSRVDFPRMKEGGMDAVFFGVFVSQGNKNAEGYRKAKDRAETLFDTIRSAVGRFPQLAGIALTPGDAVRLKREGRSAVFIGMENGYPAGTDLSLIRHFYNRGARYITLCHTKNNDICDSSTDTAEYNGLSEFGYRVVEEMNRVGMMIDISHVSDSAFYDVLRVTRAPVIASHSCARALCDNPRNLDDGMLRALAENGGVIQVCILSDYVKRPEPNPARDSARAAVRKKYPAFEAMTEEELKNFRKEWYRIDADFPAILATVSDVVDHIDHIVRIAGVDHVGIGTDFDGGGGVEDCYDASQMKNITRELLHRGYPVKEIRKIWGGNLLRVMDDVSTVSGK